MAAASAIKGEEPSERGPGGSQSNAPLKAESNHQGYVKHVALNDKQNALVESDNCLREKPGKDEAVVKKFIDAPLPATNAWVKRSASLSSAETNQVQSSPEPKKGIFVIL